MSLYVIGIGGTGAKCLEAIIQMAAIGLFNEQPIKLLFVDADESNGNLERARSSLKKYQNCYKLMSGDKQRYGWLKTPIESYDLWSPFGNTNTNKSLASFFNYNSLKQNNPDVGDLFDVLYTEEERKANLDVGFRGRPAIGSAVMSRVDLDNLDEEPWNSIIGQIQQDAGSGQSTTKVLLCGSIFGGTGASGLPTIGRLIHNKLNRENIREKVKIACLFVLPYFSFVPTGAGNDIYARSEQFLLNTEAALRYYVNQAKMFDSVYLLGNKNFSQYEFSIGRGTQRNETHFIELYAALAAQHFLQNTSDRQTQVVLINREHNGKLVWNDLPQTEKVKKELINATRFAYVWLSNIVPELEYARSQGVNRASNHTAWFNKFYQRGGLPDFDDSNQQEAIEIISKWCKDYLRWLYDIHSCDGDDIELFNHEYLALDNFDGSQRGENLSNLVAGDRRDNQARGGDTVQKIQQGLLDIRNLTSPNQGTSGLAKALYILCRI
jgi:hypothetical protein